MLATERSGLSQGITDKSLKTVIAVKTKIE